MRLLAPAAVFAVVVALADAFAAPPRPMATHDDPPARVLAGFEDNRRSAGRRRGDTLLVALDIRTVRWRPQGPDGVELAAYAFVERGREARIPGPLLRVPAGTVVRATLHNTTGTAMAVFGLHDRVAGRTADSLVLADGASGERTFRASSAGSYYYWARARRAGAPVDPRGQVPGGLGAQGPLVGALIVDPVGTAPPRGERVLLLTRWHDPTHPGVDSSHAWRMMVNGASWPYTERLAYTAGDTVRWRLVNASGALHPMHLHGFYFDVTARGDRWIDTLYTPAQRRAAVTELVEPFTTMSLSWVPDRPGNWLLHCHLLRHMEMAQRIPIPGQPAADAHRAHAPAASPDAPDAPDAPARHRAEDHMSGLVVGIAVRARRGREGRAASRRATGDDRPPGTERALRLLATSRPRVFGAEPGYAFVLQEGATAPAADSMRIPGTPLALVRGEPTRIAVVNRAGTPLSVHWHGMEIESWFDGVGGWSGANSSLRPPIAPGDSFAVRMTPRRAGTFIYHTHDETGEQLGSGLYGALIVREPGAVVDTTRDHVVVLGLHGPNRGASLAINGRRAPPPLLLATGVPHRIRFVSIPASELVTVELVRADSVQQAWRPLASDGADLPEAQRIARRARVQLSAGQTLDVEVTVDSTAARPGRYALLFRTFFYPATGRPPETTLLPIRAAP